ncbi:heavy-metal-associated domain-containing protein [Alcaligenaceae bacterium]|nr:heavy-metal-associated domain-containing protein [Alcaligenaceae bacterium]
MQIGMLKLAGMKNELCAGKLAQALKAVNGVSDANVSFGDSKATVSYNEDLVSTQRLQVAIEDAGYSIAKPVHGEDGNCCGGCGG